VVQVSGKRQKTASEVSPFELVPEAEWGGRVGKVALASNARNPMLQPNWPLPLPMLVFVIVVKQFFDDLRSTNNAIYVSRSRREDS